MKYIIHYILYCLVPYCSTDFVRTNRKAIHLPHCEGSEKNAIIERFFNIIFSEFHTTPPVCVCVQMCAGQSTYCYPNACLKRDDLRRVDAPQPLPDVAATVASKKQFMFVVDENPDVRPVLIDIDDIRGDVVTSTTSPYSVDFFKDFKTFKKFRKHLPQVELRYNLRESVKNLKSDIFKIESADLAKTRWPMSKYNVVSGHRLRPPLETASPRVGKSKFFISMLSDNNVAYPPKYFKRDLTNVTDDLSNIKDVYLYDNAENFSSFSLETLIDNLIKINVDTNPDLLSVLNATEPKPIEDSVELSVIPLNYSERIQDQENAKSTDILSINMTQETNDKNKYTQHNQSINFNGMISSLAKKIDKQNNTSMEMAKRLVADLENELTTEEVMKETKEEKEVKKETRSVTEKLNTEIDDNKSLKSANTETTLKTRNDDITPTTVANVIEATVTRKVKLRSPRKLGSKTAN